MKPLRRYFFDTEFLDDPKEFALDFISFGIVAENDREFYGVNKDFDPAKAARNPWVQEHVVAKLPPRGEWKSIADIRQGILNMIKPAEEVEFWAKNGSYDVFILCHIFGGMDALRATLLREKGIQRVVFRDSNELRRLHGPPGVADQPDQDKHIAICDARQEKREFDDYMERFGPTPAARRKRPQPRLYRPNFL